MSDSGNEQSTVYVVATVHPIRPRPRVEGVYLEEEDAENGRREALDELNARSAKVHEIEVR